MYLCILKKGYYNISSPDAKASTKKKDFGIITYSKTRSLIKENSINYIYKPEE